MALYKDTDLDTLRKYLPVKGEFDINLLLTVIEDVEQDHIVPALGDTLYDSINFNYNNGGLSAAQLALMPYLQRAIAPFLLLYGKDIININVGNDGFTITVGEETKPAFEWQIMRFEKTISKLSFNRVEKLLSYLEKNKATYPDWANSDAYTIFKECFINSAKEFTLAFSKLNYSRQLFTQFKPIMLQVEDEFIKPILGSTLFDQLKQQITGNSLTPANKDLLPYIQRTVAYQTVLQAVDEMALEITPNALLIPFHSDRDNIQAAEPQNAGQRSILKQHCERKSNHFRAGLKAFLDMNYETYPDYDYVDGESQDLDNEDRNIFMLD